MSRTKSLSELSNGIFTYELHASDDVTLHEGAQIRKERFASVFIVKLFCQRGPQELAHFQLRNRETVSVDFGDDFSGLGVTVRLDHGERLF